MLAQLPSTSSRKSLLLSCLSSPMREKRPFFCPANLVVTFQICKFHFCCILCRALLRPLLCDFVCILVCSSASALQRPAAESALSLAVSALLKTLNSWSAALQRTAAESALFSSSLCTGGRPSTFWNTWSNSRFPKIARDWSLQRPWSRTPSRLAHLDNFCSNDTF
jgi:hypothetical protein